MIKIMLSLMILSTVAFGETIGPFGPCYYSGEMLGSGSKWDQIDEFCQKIVLEHGHKLVNDDREIFAYGNIIIVKTKKGKITISGKASGLTEVKRVAYDSENDRLIVLDCSNFIMTYELTHSGNIAPKFRFSLERGIAENIVSIVPLSKFKSMILIDEEGTFLVYNLEATAHSPKAENSTKPLKRFGSVDTGVKDVRTTDYDREKFVLKITHSSGESQFDLTNFPELTRK